MIASDGIWWFVAIVAAVLFVVFVLTPWLERRESTWSETWIELPYQHHIYGDHQDRTAGPGRVWRRIYPTEGLRVERDYNYVQSIRRTKATSR